MTRAIDQASDREIAERELLITHIRAASNKRITPLPSGDCPWCGDETEPAEVFCCTECAKDWQEHNQRKQIAARISGIQR